MRKYLLALTILFISGATTAQVFVTWQVPSTGMLTKSQLWNMIVTNAGGSAATVRMELLMREVVTGQPVMSATTSSFLLSPGSQQISASTVGAVQYIALSPDYIIEPEPESFLPQGFFEVCVSVQQQVSEYYDPVAEECIDILIEPLSPPLLVYPYDNSETSNLQPQFSWLPPTPIQNLRNLNYDYQITEILPTQSAVDAMQTNVPILLSSDVIGGSLNYPISAPQLQANHTYAWRVIAKVNQMPLAESEVWQFSVKPPGELPPDSLTEIPYMRLKRKNEWTYTVFTGHLKFEYVNETKDTTWDVTLTDLSDPSIGPTYLDLHTVPLSRGMNLVDLQLDLLELTNNHLYLLEVLNTRKESWKLRFQYRASETNN